MYSNMWCHEAKKPVLSAKTARRNARKKNIYVYKCPNCPGWHITSQYMFKGKDNIKP